MKAPKYIPRHMGVVLYKDGRKVFLPPDAMFFGRAFYEDKETLEDIAKDWLNYVKNHPNARTFCEIKDYYMFKDEEGNDRRGDLRQLNHGKFMEELIRRVTADEIGSDRLIVRGGDEIFAVDGKFFANMGQGTCLSAEVLSKSNDQFYGVDIKGPRKKSASVLDSITCTGMSARYNRLRQVGKVDDSKKSYSGLEVLCIHAGALLFAAADLPLSEHAYRVEGWKPALGEFFVPFDPGLRKRGTKDGALVVRNRARDRLMMEMLVERYFNGSTLYEISRKLCDMFAIYDDALVQMIKDGDAGYEVVPITQTPDMGALHKCQLIGIRRSLYSKGYRKAGFVREFADTEFETLCENYMHKDGREVRLVYLEGCAPFLRKRIPISGEKVILGKFQKQEQHPAFSIDIKGKYRVVHDDRTRRDTLVHDTLAYLVQTPDKIAEMTREMIDRYRGGVNALWNDLPQELKDKSFPAGSLGYKLFRNI